MVEGLRASKASNEKRSEARAMFVPKNPVMWWLTETAAIGGWRLGNLLRGQGVTTVRYTGGGCCVSLPRIQIALTTRTHTWYKSDVCYP